MGYQPVPASMHAIPLTFAGTVAIAVDEKRTNLMEFGRYVQEMLPKFVQHAQITHRYVRVHYCMTCTITVVHACACTVCTVLLPTHEYPRPPKLSTIRGPPAKF